MKALVTAVFGILLLVFVGLAVTYSINPELLTGKAKDETEETGPVEHEKEGEGSTPFKANTKHAPMTEEDEARFKKGMEMLVERFTKQKVTEIELAKLKYSNLKKNEKTGDLLMLTRGFGMKDGEKKQLMGTVGYNPETKKFRVLTALVNNIVSRETTDRGDVGILTKEEADKIAEEKKKKEEGDDAKEGDSEKEGKGDDDK